MTRDEVKKLVDLYVFGQQFDAIVEWIWLLEQENERLRNAKDGQGCPGPDRPNAAPPEGGSG